MSKKTESRVSELSGELVSVPTEIEIPFSPSFDIEALKAVDPEPVFATVRIRAGRGDQGQGPLYDDQILSDLEKQIYNKKPPGFRGHQEPTRVSWEWREPVTSWVGAKFHPSTDGRSGELLVKGYIPPTAGELRTQLRLAQAGADVVNSVSIFGTRAVRDDLVTSFDLWSLDWTPKGRAGMQTELISVSGEQTKEDETVDRDEVIRSLTLDEVPADLRTQIQQEVLATLQPVTAAVGEMKVILELDNDDPEAVVEAVRGLVASTQTSELEAKVEEAIEANGQISGEIVADAVRNAVLPSLSPKASDEEIAAEIASALERSYIKALVDGQTIPVIAGKTPSEDQRKGTAWA